MRRKKAVGANTVRPRSLAAARDRTDAQCAPLHHAPKGSPLRGANSPPYFTLYYNVPPTLSMPYFTLCKTTKITNNFRPFCPVTNMLTKYEQFIDKTRTTV